MGGFPPIKFKNSEKIALLPFVFIFRGYDVHLFSQSRIEFER